MYSRSQGALGCISTANMYCIAGLVIPGMDQHVRNVTCCNPSKPHPWHCTTLSHDDCQLIAALFEYVLPPLLVHQVQLPVQPLMIKTKV